jgi:hypothetical protein
MSDDEILAALLELNLERAQGSELQPEKQENGEEEEKRNEN